MQKKRSRKKGRGPSAAAAALAATLALALAMYLLGGVGTRRPDHSRDAEIAENVGALRAMESETPADLDAAARQQRLARVKANNGIMVPDLAAEQAKVLSMSPPDKAQLARWFEGTAIVGDSIVEDTVHYGWLAAPPVFAKTGIRALPELELLDEVEAARPSVIFLCFGMNDMENYEDRVEVFNSRYKTVIHRLRVSLPEAVVYVQAIFPGADRVLEKRAYYQYRDMYNETIRQLCDELGAYYVDSSFLLEQRPEFFNNDGVHMTRDFYPYWLCYLADIAGLSNDESE